MRSSQSNRDWHNQSKALRVGSRVLPLGMSRLEYLLVFAEIFLHTVSGPHAALC